MTAAEFRENQNFEYEHFLELTDSGNKPDLFNIDQFAEDYHQAKLKTNFTPDEVESEDLKTEVFMLANKLALSGEGDAAVRMHRICNSLWSIS
jgi:hypothetical protein